MNKIFTFLLFLCCSISQAQPKLIFSYDTAGNQITRTICISGSCTSKPAKEIKEIEALAEEDLLKFSEEDFISYYPNPVKEELYLKWELVADKTVTSVYLYAMNGQVLKTYNNLKNGNTLNIPFLEYPTGTYLLVLVYNDGEQKTIKIVK